MNRIVLDGSFANQLGPLTGVVEFCDPSGKVLGRFYPYIYIHDNSGTPVAKLTSSEEMSEWEPVTPGPTEEELDRREQETETYSLAEVMAKLEKL